MTIALDVASILAGLVLLAQGLDLVVLAVARRAGAGSALALVVVSVWAGLAGVVAADAGVRVVVDLNQPVLGVAILLAVGVLACVLGVQLVVRRRTVRHGYARLRREIERARDARPPRAVIDEWHRRLAELDDVVGASGSSSRVWRPLALVPSVVALVLVLVPGTGVSWGGFALACVLVLVSLVLVLASTRVAASVRAAAAERRRRERAEVTIALEAVDRRAARRVPGFGERVATALAILREQQAAGRGGA